MKVNRNSGRAMFHILQHRQGLVCFIYFVSLVKFRVRIGARRGMWFGYALRAGIADPTSGSAHMSVQICEAMIAAVQCGRTQLAAGSRKERPSCLNTSPGRPQMSSHIGLVCCQMRAFRVINLRRADIGSFQSQRPGNREVRSTDLFGFVGARDGFASRR